MFNSHGCYKILNDVVLRYPNTCLAWFNRLLPVLILYNLVWRAWLAGAFCFILHKSSLLFEAYWSQGVSKAMCSYLFYFCGSFSTLLRLREWNLLWLECHSRRGSVQDERPCQPSSGFSKVRPYPSCIQRWVNLTRRALCVSWCCSRRVRSFLEVGLTGHPIPMNIISFWTDRTSYQIYNADVKHLL